MIRKLTTIVLSVTILLSLVAVAGCGAPSPAAVFASEPAETKSMVAEPVDDEPCILDIVPMTGVDANVIVTGVEEITDAFYASEGDKFITPWVFIKNTGMEVFAVDFFAFILVDTDGTEYEASIYTPGNYYKGVDVLPGGIIEGPVYFEVPQSAEAALLKIKPDLAWTDTNMIEIGLQDTAGEPDVSEFTADPTDYFGSFTPVDLGVPCDYDGKLAVQVNDAYYTESDMVDPPCDSYAFFQVELTVGNLTDEELDVTLDYMYKLYSPEYGHMLEQIPLPFTDNELWIVTMPAGDIQDYVLTFEVKADCADLYLVVQDFFTSYDPVLFALN